MARNIRISSDFLALLRFVRTLRALRPDIVHAHTPKAGMLAMLAAAWLRVPLRVYHCHGLRYETARGPLRAVLWGAEWLACRLATQVLAVSPSLRDALIEARLVPAAKLELLLGGSVGGVDPNRFLAPEPRAREEARDRLGIPREARVIGFVGRVVRDKGVVELYEAWKRLRPAFPDARMVVVGPIEEGDPIPHDVLAGLRSDPRVHLHGISQDTLPFYRAMDVLALPTHREGFGVVNLEAAAMSLPVVATRVNGCVDAVVDGITGTLVPPHDPDRLAMALARYLRQPDLRARHGDAGRARAIEHFRPEAYWAALQDGYGRWMNGSSRPRREGSRTPRIGHA